jgi:benzylsuccinate CoA-transferase BbsF subunit
MNADAVNTHLPLEDIRVLEIGYGIAAPVCARTLGQFGADAIRVESVRRPDSLRTTGAGWVPLSVPWEIRRDTGTGINGFTCPEKRSVSLELDVPAGRAAFDRLVANSDVLVMNMSVDAVENLGLQYEQIHKINPALIYLNLFSFGSEGPYRSFRTWGGNLSALAGLTGLVGWPDRAPNGLPLSFPDYPSSMWGVIAVLAALLRRDVTGEGAELEVAQLQVAIECIAPSVVRAGASGTEPPRTGDRSPRGAPDGIFATSQPDRYVVVSILDDDDWSRLARVEGLESLAGDERLHTAAGRERHDQMLGSSLSAWTSNRTAWESTWRLQEVGIAAFPVVDNLSVLADDHLSSRSFFQALPHARFDAELCYGQGVTLSETPARSTRAAPAFGEHTREVLREVAELGEDDIDELLETGAAHEMTYEDVRLERPYYGWIAHLLRLQWPPASVDPAEVLFARLQHSFGSDQ